MELLNLPATVLRIVFEQCDPNELVLLSFCSSKTAVNIKNAGLPRQFQDLLDDKCHVRFHWTLDFNGLELKKDRSFKREKEWTFKPPPLREAHEYNTPFTFRIDGLVYKCWTHPQKECFYWIDCRHNAYKARTFVVYVLDLFNMDLIEFFVDPCWSNIDCFFLAPKFQRVKRVIFQGGTRESQLVRVLEKCECLEVVRVHSTLRRALRQDSKLLAVPSLYVEDVYGLRLQKEHFVNFTGKYGIFKEVDLTADDYVAIVKNWLNNENSQLAYIMCRNHGTIDFQRVFSQLDTIEVDLTQREKNYPMRFGHLNTCVRLGYFCCGFRCGYSRHGIMRDILREDGLLATLCVIPFAFLFVVWHDRFPTDTAPDHLCAVL